MNFEYADRVKQMRPSIIRELLKQTADPSLISFAGGNPAPEAFPAEDICRISNDLLCQSPAACLQYSITEGLPALRSAAKEYLNSNFSTVKESDDILVCSGSQQVMDFLTKLLCNEGDTVACENPAFLGALNSFRSYGVKLAAVNMQPDGVDLNMLENVLTQTPKPKFFYTIPNFQNPTGYTTSAEKRKKIYDLCKKHNVPILEDNPYGELRINGEDLPPIKSLDEDGLVIYAASLSKILAPGLRVAFCVAQNDLIRQMVIAKQGNDVHTNLWAQQIAGSFLQNCDMPAHISHIRSIYKKKAEKMMQLLDEKLGGKISYVRPEGGMFIWLTLPQSTNMQEFVKACLADKLAIVPGNAFMVDESAPCQSVRLNFTTPSFEQMEKGIEIMARHVK